MKQIAIVQRAEFIEKRNETCDLIDQRLTDFLLSNNYFPIFLPNNTSYVKMFIKNVAVDGIILSGGDALTKYNGISLERDEVERLMIKFSMSKDIPLLGICRGMQAIQDFFQNNIHPVKSHVNTKHVLKVQGSNRFCKIIQSDRIVNSYHNYGSFKVEKNFLCLATSDDGVVEAIKHDKKEIYGIMWHPERNKPFRKADKLLIKYIFGS